jgi:hypothetical protein
MMIYLLQPYVRDKIKSVCDTYLATLPAPTSGAWKAIYLDYEPDKESILSSDVDAVIACYGKTVTFPDGSGSNTGQQSTVNTLTVDCYGFGDPIKTVAEDESYSFDASVREAQKRAQILATIAYRAIMDRRENQGATGIPKWFGSGLTILDRYPLTITKGSPIGNIETKRGICVYRAEFRFNFTEAVPSEPLGQDYAGASSITSETTDPA